MIVEGMTPRRPQLAADYLAAGNRGGSQQPSGRPVSWHPSTYAQMPLGRFQQQQPHANNYPLSTPAMYNDHQEMYYGQPQFSPMLTSYSNNTSPASSFSPLPFGHQGADGTPYGHFDGWGLAPKTNSQPLAVPNGYATTMAPRQLEYDHTAAARSGLDWNQFIIHGFNSTSPPTPELVAPLPTQPGVSGGDNSPYQETVDEPEDEGEILVGMGLYDPPEKCYQQEDPHLNNYRSTVSSLLGSTFRPHEPQGKGLKLEETWEPPPKSDSDDEEDEEDEDDDDVSKSS
jgi:hypothetical protein